MAPMDGIGESTGWSLDDLLAREWLAVNHIGGFASSTLAGLNTRKYHGLLVAAMSPPVRRLVLLSRVEETVTCDGWPAALACNEYPGTIHPQGHQSLRAFSSDPFPRWAYQGAGWAIEKSLQLLRGRNAVLLSYTLLGGSGPVQLDLRPLLALRPIHELMYQWNGWPEAAEISPGHHRVPATSRSPEVFFAHNGQFDGAGAAWYFNTIYRHEMARGYAGLEDLFSPGAVKWTLEPGQIAYFVCSAEPIELSAAISQAESQSSTSAFAAAPMIAMPARDTDHDLLVRAVEPFVLDRAADSPAASRSSPGMITRFPWASPSVRDALIAMPGVLLITGQHARAKSMLLDLAGYLRDGMLPTEFPEDAGPPTFAGADASLWFVNAAWHYLRYSHDEPAIARLIEPIAQIIAANQSCGASDVGIDSDGLIFTRRAGATWMDARSAAGFVTPRVGCAVELNALWYNAVRIGAELSEMLGQSSQAHRLNELAFKIADAFNGRFWNDAQQCCYDLVSENSADAARDASIRPNQLLAASLPFAVLRADRHKIMLETLRRHLLTPYGLRTLAPADSGYRGHYGGDAPTRDAALHQGTVHAWLLGAYVTAYLRIHGRGEAARREALKLIKPLLAHMRDSGMGQVRELFDGDPPHHARGGIAVAPVAGELLRCYVEEILDLRPAQLSSAGKTPQLRPVIAAPVPSIKH